MAARDAGSCTWRPASIVIAIIRICRDGLPHLFYAISSKSRQALASIGWDEMFANAPIYEDGLPRKLPLARQQIGDLAMSASKLVDETLSAPTEETRLAPGDTPLFDLVYCGFRHWPWVGPLAIVLACVIWPVSLALARNELSQQPAAAAPPIGVALAAEAPFLKENDAAMTRMMGDMDVKPTGNVDHDFVAMMVPHHQGAIDMSKAELSYGHNEQLLRIAQEIVVEELQEIAAMRAVSGEKLTPSEATLAASSANATARPDFSRPGPEGNMPLHRKT
jgi:Domain of unknown function (DUF305)